MRGPSKSEWRSVVRGNAPVRYERADGSWVEIRPTRVAERALYEVSSSRGQTARCEKYFEALSAAERMRADWDGLSKLGKRRRSRDL